MSRPRLNKLGGLHFTAERVTLLLKPKSKKGTYQDREHLITRGGGEYISEGPPKAPQAKGEGGAAAPPSTLYGIGEYKQIVKI